MISGLGFDKCCADSIERNGEGCSVRGEAPCYLDYTPSPTVSSYEHTWSPTDTSSPTSSPTSTSFSPTSSPTGTPYPTSWQTSTPISSPTVQPSPAPSPIRTPSPTAAPIGAPFIATFYTLACYQIPALTYPRIHLVTLSLCFTTCDGRMDAERNKTSRPVPSFLIDDVCDRGRLAPKYLTSKYFMSSCVGIACSSKLT